MLYWKFRNLRIARVLEIQKFENTLKFGTFEFEIEFPEFGIGTAPNLKRKSRCRSANDRVGVDF